MKKMLKKVSVILSVMLLVFSVPVFADEPTENIVETAVGNPDFSILVSALQKADLVDTLSGEGPFTVFAPTNDAFAALLAALDITAEELLAQPDLAKVLTYHVVAGKVMSTDLTDGLEADTVNGEALVFDLSDGVKVNDSTVVSADIEATNGVIHVIDSVLVPENFTLQEVNLEETTTPQTGLPLGIPYLFTAALTAGGAVVFFKKKKA